MDYTIPTKLSITTITTKKRDKETLEYRDQKVYKYLKRKLRIRKCKDGKSIDNRPTEIKILWTAKACGLTYKQTRTRIDKLVKNKIIEKFTAWTPDYKRVNYYRWIRQ